MCYLLTEHKGAKERGKWGNKRALLNWELAGEFTSGGAISRKVVRTKFVSCVISLLDITGTRGYRGNIKGTSGRDGKLGPTLA